MGQIFVKHCPLCDSQRFESAQEVSGYALTVCLDCGHIFLNAISTETQGLYEVYAPDPGNIAKEVEAQKARVANVMRFQQPPGKLVDVGCGPGFFLKAARDGGFAVQGCELSTGCVQFARSTWGIEILQGDFCECPLEPGIQAITMYHTLEHTREPRRYISRARDLLARRGVLVIEVPNILSFDSLYHKEQWEGLCVPAHLQFFARNTLDRLLRDCGFRVLTIENSISDFYYAQIQPYLTRLVRNWSEVDKFARMFEGLVLVAYAQRA